MMYMKDGAVYDGIAEALAYWCSDRTDRGCVGCPFHGCGRESCEDYALTYPETAAEIMGLEVVNSDNVATKSTEGTVKELCSVCDSEIEMVFDVEEYGFKAYCPVCGEVLMLCNECMRRGLDCDRDNWTKECRFSKEEKN